MQHLRAIRAANPHACMQGVHINHFSTALPAAGNVTGSYDFVASNSSIVAVQLSVCTPPPARGVQASSSVPLLLSSYLLSSAAAVYL